MCFAVDTTFGIKGRRSFRGVISLSKSSNNEQFSHRLVHPRCSECSRLLLVNEATTFPSQVTAQPPPPPQGDGNGPRGPPGPPMKGCENPPANPPKLSECCADFPNFYSKEVMKNNCSETCGKGPDGFCCKSDCMLNTTGVLTNGKIDATKVEAALTKLTADIKDWTPAVSLDLCQSAEI